MARPLVVPLPPNIRLWGDCRLRVAALNPADGSIVTGVTITSFTIECVDVRGNLKELGPFMLVPGPGA
jgi:hypothetical protein